MQVLSMYGGPLEFLFVVENKEDPAYESISQLMHDLEVCLIAIYTFLSFLSNRHSRIESVPQAVAPASKHAHDICYSIMKTLATSLDCQLPVTTLIAEVS